jgi:hypothetical protein
MPTFDTSRVQVQWSDIGETPTSQVIGTYSFGLLKIEESGRKTVLLRPKVVIDDVLKYVSPGYQGKPRRPSHNGHGHWNSKSHLKPRS